MAKRTYSETQMRRIVKKAQEETVTTLTNGIFGIYAMALHDIWHFDGEDLKKLKERVDELIIGIDDGSIKANDIRIVLKDELGVEYKF